MLSNILIFVNPAKVVSSRPFNLLKEWAFMSSSSLWGHLHTLGMHTLTHFPWCVLSFAYFTWFIANGRLGKLAVCQMNCKYFTSVFWHCYFVCVMCVCTHTCTCVNARVESEDFKEMLLCFIVWPRNWTQVLIDLCDTFFKACWTFLLALLCLSYKKNLCKCPTPKFML